MAAVSVTPWRRRTEGLNKVDARLRIQALPPGFNTKANRQQRSNQKELFPQLPWRFPSRILSLSDAPSSVQFQFYRAPTASGAWRASAPHHFSVSLGSLGGAATSQHAADYRLTEAVSGQIRTTFERRRVFQQRTRRFLLPRRTRRRVSCWVQSPRCDRDMILPNLNTPRMFICHIFRRFLGKGLARCPATVSRCEKSPRNIRYTH